MMWEGSIAEFATGSSHLRSSLSLYRVRIQSLPRQGSGFVQTTCLRYPAATGSVPVLFCTATSLLDGADICIRVTKVDEISTVLVEHHARFRIRIATIFHLGDVRRTYHIGPCRTQSTQKVVFQGSVCGALVLHPTRSTAATVDHRKSSSCLCVESGVSCL